ncbi:MAG: PAS domain-containing protein [Tenuifilaceae bacterium]
MKYFQNLNLSKRIQLFIIPIVVILYAASGFTLYKLSAKRVLLSAQNEMSVYIDKMIEIAQFVENQTENGYTNNDYIHLKPFYNQNAFYKTAFPYIIDNTGQYLIHFFKEGQRIPNLLFQQIKLNPKKEGVAEFTEYKDAKMQNMLCYYKYFEPYNGYIAVSLNKAEVLEGVSQNRTVHIIIVLFASLVFFICIGFILKPIVYIIQKVTVELDSLSNGQDAEKITYNKKDEIGQIIKSLNKLIDGLRYKTYFADEIGKNHLDANFETIGPQDLLGNSLLNMKESLKAASIEDVKRKQEDELRNWATSGLAKFGEILRQNNNNLTKLADNVIQNLVNYLNSNQGGLFIYNDDDPENKHLELVSAFAYNRKKFLEKRILLGEGLVGTCAVEKETIYLKEIPREYIQITSGLGEAVPTSLLIVPLKLENSIFGVIEIASFNEFSPNEIDFVQKIGESIASTLSAVKNSIRTNQLLEQSQQQREEMAAQEEEMRQNMEEMQATQEEMARKSIEMEGMTAAINEALLYCELNEDGSLANPNNNLLSLLGYSRQELDGVNLTELIHHSERGMFQNFWSEVMSGSTYKDTMHWVSKNNTELYIITSISPALDELGSIYKIYFLGQDVTESKQLEIRAQKQAEEIEQSMLEIRVEQELNEQREEEMKALLQALDFTCLVTELDPSGQITYINNKNTEVLGGKKEEIEGLNITEIDSVAKSNPKEFKKFWNNLSKGLKQTREFNLSINNKSIWISEHYTPIVNEHGQVTKIINIGFDISDIKQKEIQMSALLAELETLRKKKE